MIVPTVFTTIISLLLGAAVGSFLNVVILRTKSDQPWWFGRSACPNCGTVLRWYELVPVLSFVALGGQCRHCHQALTRQYFIVEVLTALTFLAIMTTFGFTALTAVGWLMASAMIALGVYDARWALLPDEFSIAFGLLAVVTALLLHRPWQDILLGGAAGAAFFGAQFLLSRKTWVGSGDILLGAGLGLLLGWRLLALDLFLAYLVGALIAAILLLSRRLSTSSSIPFGPYLLSAGFVSWLWGDRIVDWYFHHAIFH